MTSRGSDLDLTSERPAVIRHGRLYLSVGVVAILASGVASFFIARAQLDELVARTDRIELLQDNLATKKDVEKLGDRMDALYTLLIEHQEAHPERRAP